jgi:uncharacterized repeat protein (TIGR01451 family)/fimbrial isopeptide formation D2 family protein
VTDGANNSYGVEKTSIPLSGSEVNQGDTITYSVAIRNTGEQPIAPATITDNLSAVLSYADVVSGSLSATSSTSGNTPASPTIAGSSLTWSGPLAVSEVVTVRYQVKVHQDAWGVTIQNSVIGTAQSPTGPLVGNCVTGFEANCQTTHTTDSALRSYTVGKVSNPTHNSTVKPGDTITYTITARNTGELPITTTLTDDVSSVIHAADINVTSLAVASSLGGATPASPTLLGNTISWQGSMAPQEVITITYNVKVKPDMYEVAFRNGVTSNAFDPDSNIVDGGCTIITQTGCYSELITGKKPVGAPDTGGGQLSLLPFALLGLPLAIIGVLLYRYRHGYYQ